ncbi:MAG: PD-(D/E)XK nuclease domain-containing protein [Desulfovibrio sp.]|nr:PD-(D/E)XK nuclease domain-containing protein [Desulfovibrio sp.]
MNNLKVVTTTSNSYTDCFGFTEEEVFSAMEEYGLTAREEVKQWYDGFIFGTQKEMYNPWSIVNYLAEKRCAPYWAQTSSNALVGKLMGQANAAVKEEFGTLLRGGSITTTLDEEIVFSQIYDTPGAIWSFLLASGYVKPLAYDAQNENYKLALTNGEVRLIMRKLVSRWFYGKDGESRLFQQALLSDNLAYMNTLLRDIAQHTFSFFDTGGKHPERFYHAFVLGLIVDLQGRYDIRSNRESGLGRYDVTMIPLRVGEHGIVLEFKTVDPDDSNLAGACANALRQILEKNYAHALLASGLPARQIYQTRRKTPSFRTGIVWISLDRTCVRHSQGRTARISCLFAFPASDSSLAVGQTVSACGEIVRPRGIGRWFVAVKFPTEGI